MRHRDIARSPAKCPIFRRNFKDEILIADERPEGLLSIKKCSGSGYEKFDSM
jgi:hypothetical protein